jgi:hypothetical protein
LPELALFHWICAVVGRLLPVPEPPVALELLEVPAVLQSWQPPPQPGTSPIRAETMVKVKKDNLFFIFYCL